jgi:Holliday junction resolvase RusA-like endonuclease
MGGAMIITIPGVPVPKGRPRMTREGRTYTPTTTKDAEDAVRWVLRGAFQEPLTGPLGVELAFYLRTPRSWSKKRRKQAENAPHTTRPDLDNLVKLFDAGNGTAWVDDGQIAELRAVKRYSEEPRTEITVRCL